jgi:hypothetical protein
MPDYSAYGLKFRLPFACPALPPAPAGSVPDLAVVEGPVPRDLPAPLASGVRWQAEPGRYLWRGGRRAGRFLVEGGERIVLERGPEPEDELLAFHFLDTVLAAVLRQRGMLVLHANAAVTPTGAVAITGISGAGKSTTLAALLARGCTMLADDITVLRLGHDGRVEALPGVPQFHLTEDAARGLGRDISGLPRYRWRRMKAAVPARLSSGPAPLRDLYRLDVVTGDALVQTTLSGSDKFTVAQECIYGPLLPQEHPRLFALIAALADQVGVHRLQRPADRWTTDAVAEVMLRG